jgi:hypothetical protein
MRHWLLILVVLLLPLRGGMADAMAAEALRHAGAGMQSHAHAVEHGTRAAHGHDCEGHALSAPVQAEAAQPAAEAASAQADADCPTCASCQVCSSVALSPASAGAAATVFSQPRPHAAPAAFASAEPAHFFKPPRH